MMKSTIAKVIVGAMLAVPLGMGLTASAATPAWDITGNYDVSFEYQGADFVHDLSIAQDSSGNLTGSGGYPANGAHTYDWTITSGTVDGNVIDLHADYTAGADAVTPLTTMHMVGTIGSDGSLSGTWSDNYQGGARSGSWTIEGGVAMALGQLHAEDFGVVNYDTGLGMLKGYSAGFGLTDATFEDVQSVVVKLYAGNTLLQTNTATAKVGDTITGNQISSPFDVSGSFDYVTDGYWVNVRQAEYGQSVAATRVVATVVLENGKTVTAENTNLTGDPTTIMPAPVPVPNPDQNKEACKNGGWKNFSSPSFRNQGQCVSHFAKQK